MPSEKVLSTCRVCGLVQPFFPWGEDGRTPTHDICSCCGVEFGYEDATLIAIKRHREEWVSKGAKWWSPKERPQYWDRDHQLENIPEEYK